MNKDSEAQNTYKKGEIYFADFNTGMGSEQLGIRPVVIIQNDMGNKFSPTVIVAAITSQRKKDLPTHVKIRIEGLPGESIIMLEQIRTIDKSRLMCYAGKLDEEAIKRVESALGISLGL